MNEVIPRECPVKRATIPVVEGPTRWQTKGTGKCTSATAPSNPA